MSMLVRKRRLHMGVLLVYCQYFLCKVDCPHTRGYTQHALRPYIDSKINHIRHFIKIPFINKGIEFIDLPSIFRDNNVISAIPS